MTDLEIFKNDLQLPDLEIHLSPEWGAQVPGFRTRLHSALQNRLHLLRCGIASFAPWPVSPKFSISVSHSLEMGGFALLPNRRGIIGFDIEDNARVSDAVCQRVRAPTEDWPPDLPRVQIWSAKEAGFKALRGPLQPKLLSALELDFVSQSATNSQLFKMATAANQTPFQGLGAVLSGSRQTFALFHLKA